MGTLSRREKKAKSQVLGSVKASIILEKESSDDQERLSKHALFFLEMLIFNSRLIFLGYEKKMSTSRKRNYKRNDPP